MPPVLTLQTDANGLNVRLEQPEIMVAYHQDGKLTADVLQLPLQALADFGGRGPEVVTLESAAPGKVLARWDDAGVPQNIEYEAASKPFELPSSAGEFTCNPPALLQAFQEAAEVATGDHVRFAVHRLQLRGSTGEIVATDCRQLLVQRGWSFPWTEEVLIPCPRVFGAKELAGIAKIGIAKTDTHVVLACHPWTFYLRIDKEGRYPPVDEVIPKATEDSTHWHLASEDAEFLGRALPRLPGQHDEHGPLTVDLNGEVCVRARADGQRRITEVILPRSQCTGRPLRFCLNRLLLTRILDLGLTEIDIINTEVPIVAKDEKRTFVAMPLAKEAIIAHSDDAVRIVAGEPSTPTTSDSPITRRAIMSISQNVPANGHAAAATPTESHSNGNSSNSIIAEAEALKDALREVYGRANSLVTALKRHKKQSKLVQSTLASLRQLQQIEG